MRNLVLLIVALLAGAAGWYVGSWSGRDAIQALAKAKALGEQAQTAHDQVVKGLNDRLAGLGAEYAQGKKTLEDAHAQAKQEFSSVLAGRDQRIADLGRVRTSTQSQLAGLKQALAHASTGASTGANTGTGTGTGAGTGATPQDRERLQADITRLEKQLADQQTLIAGLECSKVAVPGELLAPLRLGAQP